MVKELVSISLLLVVCLVSTASAQSTAFTYQGRLADSGTSVNGNYDLQFALWNSLSGGAQVGSTQTNNSVAVNNGVFTVNLDFGANAFPGANRFLEIAVRPAGVGSFTTLTPRQPITSTPYAVRSLNAATADSVPASGVPSGSGNYIQNAISPQSASNFNITGSGTAGGTLTGSKINATTQYDLNSLRILGADMNGENLFVGLGAGPNASGIRNTFFGSNAGLSHMVGRDNTFIGTEAGESNTGGGISTSAGNFNTFVGSRAGLTNTSGSENTFLGEQAGAANISGSLNVFVGREAGNVNTTGSKNSAFGFLSSVSGTLTNATAIGAFSRVEASNSLVLGSISGVGFADSNTNVGIGTTTPQRLLHIKGSGSNGFAEGDLLITGTGTTGSSITLESTAGGRRYSWISTGSGADSGAGTLAAFDSTGGAYRMVITSQGNVGIGTEFPTALLSVNGTANKPGGGSWGTFSDERLKIIRGGFTPGLNALMRLQPLRYEYRPDNALQLKSGSEHIGFSAQAVQKVIPEAVTQTDNGYLVVNNDPILWTMLNAIKEQQKQIERLNKKIARLQRRPRH